MSMDLKGCSSDDGKIVPPNCTLDSAKTSKKIQGGTIPGVLGYFSIIPQIAPTKNLWQKWPYSGTILRYYFVAGAEIVPPNSLCDRGNKSLI